MERPEWVDERMSELTETKWQPDARRGMARLRQRQAPRHGRMWWAACAVPAALIVIALVLPSSWAVAQRLWESVFLKRVEVVEVNPEAIGSLSPSVSMNSGPPQQAADAAEAARLAGFQPVLPAGAPRLIVAGPMQAKVTLRKGALLRDLRTAGTFDVDIPDAWDGAVVSAAIQPIVIADYGDWTLTQSPHISMTVPASVSLEQFGVVVFRLLGKNRYETAVLAKKFAENPAWFLAIPREERARLKQIILPDGPAMLIEDLTDAGTPERFTLLWSTSDRVLALSGRDEAELVRIGGSLH